MISPDELEELKDQLEKLVVTDVEATLKTFKKAIPEDSPRWAELLNIEGQFNDLTQNKIKQVISFENEQITASQIRSSLITLISSLELKDFEKPKTKFLGKTSKKNLLRLAYLLLFLALASVLYFLFSKSDTIESWFSLPEDKSGHLLYKVPKRMQANQETECIVRIAFDSVNIIRDLAEGEVNLETISSTSEKMKVELMESEENTAFKIRNKLNDEEQFIEKGDFTEWKFGVTPLKEGAYDLMIVVTVLKKIDGEYVPKNIVYNKSVEIISDTIVQDELGFQSTGQIVSTKQEEAVDTEIRSEVKKYLDNKGSDNKNNSNAGSEVVELESNILINFAFNSTKYDQTNKLGKYFDDLVKRLNHTNEKVLLSGHTDNIGSENYNLKLGERRAEKIAQLLIKKGLKKDLIEIKSKGETEPVATNNSEEGRYKNRRVAIQLIKK